MMSSAPARLLEVRELSVHFETGLGTVRAVDEVSWQLHAGQTLAIVGESGSGKSVSALAVMGLLPTPPARLVGGDVLLHGRALGGLPEWERRRLRGSQVAMIFQDPMTSLNPVHRVGKQIVEMIRTHQSVSHGHARRHALELLGEVGIPHAALRFDQFPHELSGGTRQRVMIAMALANDPEVLIADEPTTALDVTVQAQVMTLLRRLQQRRGTALILITHDLGVVAGVADRVVVMYAGRVVESGTVDEIFYAPQHPYTLGLLSSLPRTDRPARPRMAQIPGAPPDLARLPSGCPFRTRCSFAIEECARTRPQLAPLGNSGRAAACLRAGVLGPLTGSVPT